MTREPYRRALSPTERVWITADALCPPFTNALVLEGRGQLDLEAWTSAVTAAADANPGAQVVLRGVLGWSRWEDSGVAPPVRAVTAPDWDGRGPFGAPFLREPLPVKSGPTCAVWLVQGDPAYVVIRSHHATMDGRGTQHFALEILRALRGDALLGSPSTITDLDLGRLGGQKRPHPPEDCIAPTGRHDGGRAETTWIRHSLALTRPSQFLPRVAWILAREARRHAGPGGGEVRFDVPVDMRPRAGAASGEPVRSTGNLTGWLKLRVPEDATPESLATAMKTELAQGRDGDVVVSIAGLRWVPLGLMRRFGAARSAENNRESRYGVSGILSNLGPMPLEGLSGAGFVADKAWLVPPSGHATALFATFSGHATGVEVLASMPTPLASGGRLEALMATLDAELSRS
jgi:hypothetical protein